MIQIESIPKGIIKVDNPDHPFAFDGPDILLSDKKGLLAVFQIRDNETPNKLLARLTNALIAYPASTQMLFLYNYKTHQPNLIFDSLKYYFNGIIEPNDVRKAKSLIADGKAKPKIKEIRNIQKRLFETQSRIQLNNLEYIEKKVNFEKSALIDRNELKEKGKYTDRLTNKETKARANIFLYNDRIIGIKSLSKSNSDIVELQPYYEFAINSEFKVDNGVPYFSHLTKKALNLNDIPKVQYDPLKPLRIASLFGWLIVNSNNLTEIENRFPVTKKK